MLKRVFLVHARLAASLLISGSLFATAAYAEVVAATSGAGGDVSSAATIIGAGDATTADGKITFGTKSHANWDKHAKDAGTEGHVRATAFSRAGDAHQSLSMSANSSTGVFAAGEAKHARANASVDGTIGAAHLHVSAQAMAISSPGQMTAQASSSNGAYAFAASGTQNALKTFVPNGITRILQISMGTESISCNAGGTCSHATMTSNAVSAGITIVTTTGTIVVGNARQVLQAFLNVEAGVGPNVTATAASNISGKGTSFFKNVKAEVSANIGTQGNSSILTFASSNGSYGGSITAKSWTQGFETCVSIKIRAANGKNQTLSKCKQTASR